VALNRPFLFPVERDLSAGFCYLTGSVRGRPMEVMIGTIKPLVEKTGGIVQAAAN
jgi:hypothetical protein